MIIEDHWSLQSKNFKVEKVKSAIIIIIQDLVQIKESLFIKKLNPELNGSETSVPLYLFS